MQTAEFQEFYQSENKISPRDFKTEFHLCICGVEFRGGISNLKHGIISLYASKIGKPQVEFRYEISDRNSAVKLRYGI